MESTDPQELNGALRVSARHALAPLQESFSAYQQAAFPARGPAFFALELAGETGELANLEKKLWRGDTVPRERLADEAADVLIALMNYANERGLDLAEAVAAKLATIEERRRQRLERHAGGA